MLKSETKNQLKFWWLTGEVTCSSLHKSVIAAVLGYLLHHKRSFTSNISLAQMVWWFFEKMKKKIKIQQEAQQLEFLIHLEKPRDSHENHLNQSFI